MVEATGQTFANAVSKFPAYTTGDTSFCCGDKISNNCAHLVSYALNAAGFTIKTAHNTINARCSNKLPVRAEDVKNWIVAKTAATQHSSAPPKGKIAFFLSTRASDGLNHCGFIDGDGDCYDTGYGVYLGEKSKVGITVTYFYK